MVKGQPNRLADGAHGWTGREIDRSAPLQFLLNGRRIAGFAGDTVLSALLANGLDSAGDRGEAPLALSEGFAPMIAPASLASDPDAALPMQRTPALDGAEFVTLGPRAGGGPLGFLSRSGRSLGHRYDQPMPLPPWLDQAAHAVMEADVVVVGGGVAGLAAAAAAAQSGSSVVLVERRQGVGGDARLFGSVENEEQPDAIIERLTRTLNRLEGVTLLLRAEALSATDNAVRVHQVLPDSDGLASRVVEITTRRVVLATGSMDRLPVFSGNRLPGVVGLAEAFDRADRFGVWSGRRTAINTSTSPGYRLAMLALDAGLPIARMSDTRLRPQSRFIEFSKAYGIPLASGLVPRRVTPHRHGGLDVHLALEMENYARAEPPVVADQFVVSGGWQPDLALWIGAGGHVRWQAGQLLASEPLPGVALAGSAAGYRSLSGCAQSGAAAIAALFGRNPVPVFDIEIDPMFETPDGCAVVHRHVEEDELPAYIDACGLSERPAPPRRRRLPFMPGPRPEPGLTGETQPLSLGALAANVALGVIPEAELRAVAHERCVTPLRLPTTPAPAHREAMLVPPYLVGRFGRSQSTWRIAADEDRHFEAGNLLYPSSDAASAEAAVGVVLCRVPEGSSGAIALIGDGETGKRLVLHDLGRQVSVRLVEAVTP